MKGALPVPYIVALIIAAIVIGILGYWFILSTSRTGVVASEQMCRAKLMGICVGKTDDFSITPNDYDECKGTELAKKVRKCGDLT